MARMTLTRATSPFAEMSAELVTAVLNARALANRIRAAMDAATTNGTVLANLEGGDFGAPAGRGSDYYVAMGWIKDGLNGIAADQLANLDQGG